MNETVSHYAPFALFLIVAVLFGVSIANVGVLFRPKNPRPEKAIPYECGNDPIGRAGPPMLPRYYFYAMLLVLFDVEVVFLVPWALGAGSLGAAGFVAVLLFFAVLMGGYAYLWRKGDLDWD